MINYYVVIGLCDCCQNHFEYAIRSSCITEHYAFTYEASNSFTGVLSYQKFHDICRSCRSAMAAHDEETRYVPAIG